VCACACACLGGGGAVDSTALLLPLFLPPCAPPLHHHRNRLTCKTTTITFNHHHLNHQGGAAALAAVKSSLAWSHPLAMLLLGIRNLGLAGWMPAECMALENEVTAWQQEAEYDQKDNALRWVVGVVGLWCRGGGDAQGCEGFSPLPCTHTSLKP